MTISYAPGGERSTTVVPLEQPILIRQYTCAVRWLTLRRQRLRDQAGSTDLGVIPGIGDRAQSQDLREQDPRDVSHDRLTNLAD